MLPLPPGRLPSRGRFRPASSTTEVDATVGLAAVDSDGAGVEPAVSSGRLTLPMKEPCQPDLVVGMGLAWTYHSEESGT